MGKGCVAGLNAQNQHIRDGELCLEAYPPSIAADPFEQIWCSNVVGKENLHFFQEKCHSYEQIMSG